MSEWEEFLVCTHFDFWSQPPVSIIDVDLDYEIPGEKRVIEKDVEADGEEIPTDGTAPRRLADHIELDPNDRTEIQLSQRFKSEPFAASDYGRVVLTFELTSPDWHGIKFLTVAGTLEAGGKLLVQEKTIASKSVNPE